MEITGLIPALLVGTARRRLGRLVVPGRRRIPMPMTLLVGVVAASTGTFAASAVGVADTSGVDWNEPAFRVGLAGVDVTTPARSRSRRPR